MGERVWGGALEECALWSWTSASQAHQVMCNELLVNCGEILAPGRLLGSPITNWSANCNLPEPLIVLARAGTASKGADVGFTCSLRLGVGGCCGHCQGTLLCAVSWEIIPSLLGWEAGQGEESSKRGLAVWEGALGDPCGSWYRTGVFIGVGVFSCGCCPGPGPGPGIWAHPRTEPGCCGCAGDSRIPWHRQQEALPHLQTREIFNFQARSYFLFKIQTDRDGCWPQQHYVTLSTTQIFSWGFLLERQAWGSQGERGGDAEVWTPPPTLSRGAWWGTRGAL